MTVSRWRQWAGWVACWCCVGALVAGGQVQAASRFVSPDVPAPPAAQAAADVPVLRLGVFAFMGLEATRTRYQPLADYLSAALPGTRVELVPFTGAQFTDLLQAQAVDLWATNPVQLLQARAQVPLAGVIASTVTVHQGQPLTHLGGLALVRADRHDIHTWADLRGRTLAVPSLSHMGGFRAQAHAMVQAGVGRPDEVAHVQEWEYHEAVVRAVLAGQADVGFVRTGTVEGMVARGELQLDALRFIETRQHPRFPFVVSTDLYPEWPVYALAHVPPEQLRRVAAALYALEPTHPAVQAAGLYGFSIPADYLPVEDMARTLRLPPFDAAPAFTWKDAWARWHLPLLALLVSTALVLLLLGLLWVQLRQARGQRARMRALLSSQGQGVYGVDPQGLCTFMNPAALNSLGLRLEQVLGKNQHLLFHHHHADGSPYPHEHCPVWQTLHDAQPRTVEDWFWRSDGSGFAVEMVVTPIFEKQRQNGVIVVFADITQRKQEQARLQRHASTDALTGLYNRRHLLQRAHQEWERCQRFGHPCALLMLDLDFFKCINDTHGHAAGDAVLRQVAQTLQEQARKVDVLGRLGGEEFVVLLTHTGASDALTWAERAREAVQALRVEHHGEVMRITVSIGVTALHQAASLDQALEQADAALYRAKQQGRNRVEEHPTDAAESAAAPQ